MYFQKANVLSLFKEDGEEARSSVRLNNDGLTERVNVTKVGILHGQAERELFSGEQCKRACSKQRRVGCVLGEPTHRSGRLLAKLAGLEASPR